MGLKELLWAKLTFLFLYSLILQNWSPTFSWSWQGIHRSIQSFPFPLSDSKMTKKVWCQRKVIMVIQPLQGLTGTHRTLHKFRLQYFHMSAWDRWILTDFQEFWVKMPGPWIFRVSRLWIYLSGLLWFIQSSAPGLFMSALDRTSGILL